MPRDVFMTGLIIRWIILTTAVISSSYLIDGIKVAGFFSALSAAAMLGILNAVLRPVLIIITLPINIITLGLFTFVINALLLKMVSHFRFQIKDPHRIIEACYKFPLNHN